MALMNCPECGKEVSDRAGACPNCGYPFSAEKDIPTTTGAAPKLNRKRKIILLASILTVALFASVFVLFIGFKKRVCSMTHTGKGYSISLGMKKEKVDSYLDELIELGDYSTYDDHTTIGYSNGCVESISTSNWSLETNRGIHVGSTVEDVFSAYGEEEISDTSAFGMTDIDGEPVDLGFAIYYYLNWNGEVCDTLDEKYSLSFYLDENMKYVERIRFSVRSY